MEVYLPILLAFFVALTIPMVMLAIQKALTTKKVTPVKMEPYECGNPVPHTALEYRFSIRYYLIAVLFIIFDVETVFLYPWAVQLKKLALFGFIEMVIFLLILIIGYIFAWRKEALSWI